MTRVWLVPLFSLLVLLSGCADREPYAGCLLAAANRRETLRAQAYLHRAIPARILLIRSADNTAGHAALVYRLDPEGWWIYDDNFGSRPLRINDAHGATIPPALTVARAAFPAWPVGRAWYADAPPPTR